MKYYLCKYYKFNVQVRGEWKRTGRFALGIVKSQRGFVYCRSPYSHPIQEELSHVRFMKVEINTVDVKLLIIIFGIYKLISKNIILKLFDY